MAAINLKFQTFLNLNFRKNASSWLVRDKRHKSTACRESNKFGELSVVYFFVVARLNIFVSMFDSGLVCVKVDSEKMTALGVEC